MKNFFFKNKQLISDVSLFSFIGFIFLGLIIAVIKAIINQKQMPTNENIFISAMIVLVLTLLAFFFTKGDSK